ncbi:MAG TPA: dihydrodipicolinate synthase family protein [Candidatus Dormibacteraeota bacterium]|nr:dihydrodipicolinate synthase family protein [Candidatus Dormibacteraeota bacterium]
MEPVNQDDGLVQVRLPGAGGATYDYTPTGKFLYAESGVAPQSRIAYAAVHVVADSRADIDWESTLAFRRHIWSYGLGVAEAMDTAQRGMGLDWESSKELIRLSVAEAKECGGRIVCGAQTDQLAPGSARDLRDIESAYEEQCAFVEAQGGQVVLMASRELARIARGPEDYERVYGRVLSQLQQPALIHWLGAVFDPALAGYWGHADLDQAAEVCLAIIAGHRGKVEGVKISLLDQKREIAMRKRLPEGVHMLTGNDFDYPVTIAGDADRYSDALLGTFDLIAPAASAALLALDRGDVARFNAILESTLSLSRHVFIAPTFHYKTGIVFVAYLNGHQDHFRMVGGLESSRSAEHLAKLFVLADKAGLLRDAELAVNRVRRVMAHAGVSGS